MGLFKRGLIKAGMIVGSIFAAGAAVGAAAKSAYKKKKNSYENKYNAKDATYTYAKPSGEKYTHMNNKGKNFKTNQNTNAASSTPGTTSSTVDLMNKEHAVFRSSSAATNTPKETASYGSATPLPNNAKAVYVWDKPRPESEFNKNNNKTTTPNNAGKNFKTKIEDKTKEKEVQKRTNAIFRFFISDLRALTIIPSLNSKDGLEKNVSNTWFIASAVPHAV